MSYDDIPQGSGAPPPTTPAAEVPATAPAGDPAPPTDSAPAADSTPPANPADPTEPANPTPPPYQYAQYPYPHGPYGYGYPPPPKPPTNGLAVGSMVVSITALMSCLIFIAPIGLVMGYNARRKIVEQHESGAEYAKLGIILGWIGTGLTVAVAVPYLVLFIVWLVT